MFLRKSISRNTTHPQSQNRIQLNKILGLMMHNLLDWLTCFILLETIHFNADVSPQLSELIWYFEFKSMNEFKYRADDNKHIVYYTKT